MAAIEAEIIETQTNQTALMPVMNLSLAGERRSQLVKFTQSIMVDGTDFGKIPGTSKPTLLKPGAEKLTSFFGLRPRYELVESVTDWTGAAHGGEPFFYFLYRCSLWRGDTCIAEADGSCNSFESKYRYRKSERACPSCGAASIRKSREEWGGGWYCSECKAKFKKGDTDIESQETGRVLNPDVADQVNTIQKMSQKRALVAVTLLAVNASEFFTQDMEDLTPGVDTETGEVKGKPEPENKSKAETKPDDHERKALVAEIRGHAARAGLAKGTDFAAWLLKSKFNTNTLHGMPMSDLWDLSKILEGLREPTTEPEPPADAHLDDYEPGTEEG